MSLARAILFIWGLVLGKARGGLGWAAATRHVRAWGAAHVTTSQRGRAVAPVLRRLRIWSLRSFPHADRTLIRTFVMSLINTPVTRRVYARASEGHP